MSKPLRILFVEDQADLRELMSDVFVQMGMEVVTLADAAAALELLAEGPQVDVLFTDVYMPGQMSGAELSMRAWPSAGRRCASCWPPAMPATSCPSCRRACSSSRSPTACSRPRA